MAHNYVYRTKIQTGVFLMCSKDQFFQKFEVSDQEFVKYQHQFLKRVDQYYSSHVNNKDHQDTKHDEKV